MSRICSFGSRGRCTVYIQILEYSGSQRKTFPFATWKLLFKCFLFWIRVSGLIRLTKQIIPIGWNTTVKHHWSLQERLAMLSRPNLKKLTQVSFRRYSKYKNYVMSTKNDVMSTTNYVIFRKNNVMSTKKWCNVHKKKDVMSTRNGRLRQTHFLLSYSVSR